MAEPTEVTQTVTDLGGACARAVSDGAVAGGERIGRYLVLELVGRGGMGVVYAAYDPELDRKVAVKLLGESSRGNEVRRIRLLREAQAMARLQHPNVIGVFDVGTVEGEVFVAMEFVDGGTLSEWRAERPRTWHEIVTKYVAAAHGLAAAHDAGLVHRDFKPDNVLVGRDGRVRVMDFGLARAAEGEEGADELGATLPVADVQAQIGEAPASSLSTSGASGFEALTRTGALLGTPAYMAPEQHLGTGADARSDQFSFCVALYEALYGERPFAGDSPSSLAFQVLQGEVRPPPPGSTVPTWVRRVVLRGLEVDPDARCPDMHSLVAALQADPRRQRRRLMAGIAVAGLVGAAAMMGNRMRDARAIECAAMGRHLEGLWDEPRRQELRAAILATGAPFAEAAWTGVSQGLDAWTRAWVRAREDACEATHLRGEQSQHLLDARMACLDARLDDARALIDELAAVDAGVLAHAVPAVHALPRVEPCADPDYVLAAVAPPTPEQAPAVARVADQIVHARAKMRAGRYEEGLTLARTAVEGAGAADYGPARAKARLVEGEILSKSGRYEEARRTLMDAFFEADTLDLDDVAADAALELVYVTGYRLARPEAGALWGRHARAKIRERDDPLRLAQLENNLGTVRTGVGDYKGARRHYERALALREGRLSKDDPELAWTVNNLGAAWWGLGDAARAREYYERALALRERALGTSHPDVAASLSNLAVVLNAEGKPQRALALHRRALEIRRAALGPEHMDVAVSWNNVGSTLQVLGRLDAAADAYEQAMVPLDRALGLAHPTTRHVAENLLFARLEQGRTSEARRLAERLLASATGSGARAYALTLLAQVDLVGLGALELATNGDLRPNPRKIRVIHARSPRSLEPVRERLRAAWSLAAERGADPELAAELRDLRTAIGDPPPAAPRPGDPAKAAPPPDAQPPRSRSSPEQGPSAALPQPPDMP